MIFFRIFIERKWVIGFGEWGVYFLILFIWFWSGGGLGVGLDWVVVECWVVLRVFTVI